MWGSIFDGCFNRWRFPIFISTADTVYCSQRGTGTKIMVYSMHNGLPGDTAISLLGRVYFCCWCPVLRSTGEWLLFRKWNGYNWRILNFALTNFFLYRISRLAINKEEPTFLGLFLDVFFGIISCALTVLSAIMITLGFIVWCSDMTQRFPS